MGPTVRGAERSGLAPGTALILGFVAGWSLAGAIERTVPRARVPEPAPGAPPRERVSLARSPPRALRLLDGIGERRAVAIARARWAHEPERGALELEDVEGIGPKTARVVALHLARSASGRAAETDVPAADTEAPEEPRPPPPLLVREAASDVSAPSVDSAQRPWTRGRSPMTDVRGTGVQGAGAQGASARRSTRGARAVATGALDPPAPARGAERRGPVDAASLDPELVDPPVRAALEEDRGTGDLTSEAAVPAGARARAVLVAKAEGVVAGLPVLARAFELCDPEARVELLASDGARVRPGDELARIEGDARALLAAERTALNFAQRLSGIATLTARCVERAAGRARILDTRKTTPGLRALEKYAVRCGGGENHRFGLYDEVMIKDNHADLAGRELAELVADVRRRVGPRVRMTVESRGREEARAALLGGADVVLLDNQSVESLRALCAELRALAAERGLRVELEASGGVGPEEVADVAATGVDRISVGALTHSAPALDLSLRMEPAR